MFKDSRKNYILFVFLDLDRDLAVCLVFTRKNNKASDKVLFQMLLQWLKTAFQAPGEYLKSFMKCLR